MKAGRLRLVVIWTWVALAGLAWAGERAEIDTATLAEKLASEKPPLVLDVRSDAEFGGGHIPGALNVPHDAVAGHIERIGDDKTREIVVYCRSGTRCLAAEKKLRELGYTSVRHLSGDWGKWAAEKRPANMSPKESRPAADAK